MPEDHLADKVGPIMFRHYRVIHVSEALNTVIKIDW
jgi:hypothetical protein